MLPQSVARWPIGELHIETVQSKKEHFLPSLMAGSRGWLVLQNKYVSEFLRSFSSTTPQNFEILPQNPRGLES